MTTSDPPEKETPEARAHRLVQQWHDAGLEAYRAGQKRTDYPFKASLRRSGMNIAWQIGWDTGALLDAMKAGASAQRDAACPYTHPFFAAHWRQGWHAVHGLRLVGGAKNPASRAQFACAKRQAGPFLTLPTGETAGDPL